MEIVEAAILLKNLMKRMQKDETGSYLVPGGLTDDEFIALSTALSNLDVPGREAATRTHEIVEQVIQNAQSLAEADGSAGSDEQVPESEPHRTALDLSVLELAPAAEDIRVCLDFGTAMSKATLVKDATVGRSYEDIHVLRLGVPGEQEEVSETMLVSSVFIDREGILWFGQAAVERSLLEQSEGDRWRLDNIKRFLSEEGMSDVVAPQFNPTEETTVYGELVLAYLMFFTWTVNKSLEAEGLPRNINRRFALPCFDGKKARANQQKLKTMLGEAQILADTFWSRVNSGVPLADFLHSVKSIRQCARNYNFVRESVTEPLGVAGSLLSWEQNVNSLAMVIDVGAGTSDFSLYRLGYNVDTCKSTALEVAGSVKGITEAGNYLDRLLKGVILNKAGITHEHPHWINIAGALELELRNYKEGLFRDGELVASLFNGEVVDVQLADFLALEQVKAFSVALKACMTEILAEVDASFVKGAPHNTLAVVLSGGGAELPMVKELAQGVLDVNGTRLSLKQAQRFPTWLAQDYPDLEADYPRIAVSLGGAREQLIKPGGTARVTAGDVRGTPALGGCY